MSARSCHFKLHIPGSAQHPAASTFIPSVKAHELEGLVAKRRDSKYEPGLRSGAWQKMRVNQGQELVIAGYTRSAKNFDALVIGYYHGHDWLERVPKRDEC